MTELEEQLGSVAASGEPTPPASLFSFVSAASSQQLSLKDISMHTHALTSLHECKNTVSFC